jgi:hypothetical protein
MPNVPTGSGWAYTSYTTEMYVPSGSCASGHCLDYLWGGIGGMDAYLNISNGNLIQSGVVLPGNGWPEIFIEIAPDGPLFYAADIIPGDDIVTWGWTTDRGKTAHFDFYNNTTDSYLISAPASLSAPAHTQSFGLTFESMVEKADLYASSNFGTVYLGDYAYDISGKYHDATTDKWIFMESRDKNHDKLLASVTQLGQPNNVNTWTIQVTWQNAGF